MEGVINEGDLPINQHVEGCITPPCLLPQLQDVVINVVFRATRTSRSMRTLATASVNFGITIDIEYDLGPNAVTCNFLTNTYCPVLKDEVIQYTLKMYIEPLFIVGTAATVEFRVVGETNEPLWCLRIPIRIVPAVNPVHEIEQNTTRLTP
ncbi:NPC intracellular cholesterol transporter 2 [Vanessa atalanta]|uniref:NPC intracellular cholesterol transporter 2 n=1 Tax=Vanessa atalanta TaxID=42275 RepID=UPI001FCD7F4F|nr:NPC intracellular cholesterol transporter 2 [Vanessa atalanta]